jgi:hypothetical protein
MLDIVERQPVAMVVLDGVNPETGEKIQRTWLLADDGVWLGDIDSIDSDVQGLNRSQLVLIKDVPVNVWNNAPEAGQAIDDPSLKNALAIVNGISPQMKAMIESISAPSIVQTTLYLKNHVEVAFGVAEDIAIKELVINQMIAEHGSALQRINVRVADRPTIKLP